MNPYGWDSYRLLPAGQPLFGMPPYERFDAWRRCHELVLAVYQLTEHMPKEERYGLVTQARRAAFSAAANIAEGSAKRGKPEFRRYLDISLGSLSELSYTLRLARDLGHITRSEWERVDTLRDLAGRLTWGLYRSVRGPART